jgi:hypothetical protein
MKNAVASFILAVAAGLALTGAAVAAEPAKDAAKGPRIQLTDKSGAMVKQLQVRDGYEGYDVLDLSHVLLRTPHFQFFVVTFEKPCDWVDYVNAFHFTPEITGWVRETDLIDARSYKGENCYVTKLQQVRSANEGKALAKKASGG